MKIAGPLFLSMIFAFSTFTFAANGVLPGNGTQSNPYLIEDFDDFTAFCDQANAGLYWSVGIHTRLVCDLDYLQDDIFQVNPMLSGDFKYNGVFDGQNHNISNFVLIEDCYGYINLGLFGQTGTEASIKNLHLSEVIIRDQCSDYVGALCGLNYGEIDNCTVNATVEGLFYSGALCGQNNGIISNCSSMGLVIGSGDIGGFCGINYGNITNSSTSCQVDAIDLPMYCGGFCGENYGVISGCYFDGSFYADDDAFNIGGFCGYNDYEISNSYSAGEVELGTYSMFVGGFCGDTYGDITYCYSAGKISLGAGASDYGGFSGGDDLSMISDSFWDKDSSGINTSYGATGKTSTQMKDMNTFSNAGWDFGSETTNGTDDIWRMPYSMPGFPILSWQKDIPGDFAGDYGVDMEDLGAVSSRWLDQYNIEDLATLARHWLEK